jgi:hypothetical protein
MSNLEGLKGLGKSQVQAPDHLSAGMGARRPFTSELGSSRTVDQEAQRIRSLSTTSRLPARWKAWQSSERQLAELVTLEWLIRSRCATPTRAGCAKTAKGGLLPDFVIDAGGRGRYRVAGAGRILAQPAGNTGSIANNLRMLGQVIGDFASLKW